MVFEILLIGKFGPYHKFWKVSFSVPKVCKVTIVILVIYYVPNGPFKLFNPTTKPSPIPPKAHYPFIITPGERVNTSRVKQAVNHRP